MVMLTRPFPGISFQAEIPTTVSLPRMDVAAFVGFAATGPINVPVVIESYLSFTNLFGDNYPLAWDSDASTWQTACLAPSVKAFFAQGGQRCWVVRVASETEGETARFPLAGVLKTTPGGYGVLSAEARCLGSWADRLQAKAELLIQPLAAEIAVEAGTDIHLPVRIRRQLEAGDLLQLTFADERHRAYAVVPESTDSDESIVLAARKIHWFRRLPDSINVTGIVWPQTVLADAVEPVSSVALQEPLTVLQGKTTLRLAQPIAVESGDWLKLESAEAVVWLLVKAARQSEAVARQATEVTTGFDEIEISDVWAEGHDATADLLLSRGIDRVRLALRTQAAEREIDEQLTLTDLVAAAPHPRFMGSLPSDRVLFSDALKHAQPGDNDTDPTSALASEISLPRFPLSFSLSDDEVIIPLGLEASAPWRGAVFTDREPLVRDGLVPPADDYQQLSAADWQQFVATLFLDPVLATVGQRSLMTEARDRIYLQSRSLTGIHSLLPIDEVSIVAVPDAAHAGWRLSEQKVVDLSPGEPDPEALDNCEKSDTFKPCPVSAEAQREDDPPAAVSLTLNTDLESASDWQVLTEQGMETTGLLKVQSAIASLAAARGDFVVLLGLQKHYDTRQALTYQQSLLSSLRAAGDTTDSYATLYHPWLVVQDADGTLLHTHPAGHIAGVMAARSRQKGAWIAPANEALQGVLSTSVPLTSAAEQTLYANRINPIRQRPQGFVTWSSATQSDDRDLQHINIRRLLILLRRLALREGQRYTFSPHSAAFRRRVQQQFEQLLNRMFELGAFAGRDPTEGFQVVIDRALNLSNSVEQGRLIVELRIAPSQPLSFITVQLIQTNSSLTTQEVFLNGG